MPLTSAGAQFPPWCSGVFSACPTAESARTDSRPEEQKLPMCKRNAFCIQCNKYKALRSAGGYYITRCFAHKEESNKMQMTESHRDVHGFRCKLATRKSQELNDSQKQPGRRMYGRNRKAGEREQCTGKPFAHHTACNIFLRPADFDVFVR